MPYLHKQYVKTLHQAVLLLTSMHINYLSLELLKHENEPYAMQLHHYAVICI